MNIANIEILMIEDDPGDAELATRAFHENRLVNSIRIITDGKDALEYLFCEGAHSARNPAHMPVLILLDLKLPLVAGIEVLRRIRSDIRTRHIPVIVMTSSREEQDIVQSSKLGINGYILKPVEYNQFLDTVGRLALFWLVLDAGSAQNVLSEIQEMAS
jgi:two-component system response regulator